MIAAWGPPASAPTTLVAAFVHGGPSCRFHSGKLIEWLGSTLCKYLHKGRNQAFKTFDTVS